MNFFSTNTDSTTPAKEDRLALAALIKKLEGADEGVCDGFTIPDEVIVRLRDPEQAPEADLEWFEAGSLTTTYFWLVDASRLDDVFKDLDTFSKKSFLEGLDPEEGDSVMLGAWVSADSDKALVCFIGVGDWAAGFDEVYGDARDTHYDWENQAVGLMFGGNDNYPGAIFDDADFGGEDVEPLPPETLSLVYSSITPKWAEESLERWRENKAGLLGGWEPKKKRAHPSL